MDSYSCCQTVTLLTCISVTLILTDMKDIPLKKFLSIPGNSQASVGRRLGMSQGAISFMVTDSRDVYITEFADGSIKAYEKVSLPSRRRSAA